MVDARACQDRDQQEVPCRVLRRGGVAAAAPARLVLAVAGPPGTANAAFTDPDHLTRTLRRGLSHIQRHPELIDGCLAETGLTITPHQPT